MKKTLMACMVVTLLAGCVTNPAQVKQKQEFDKTLKALVEQRDSGAIENSAFYAKVFDNSYKHPDQELQSIWREHYSDMIIASRVYESGQVDRTTFLDAKRLRTVKTEQAIHALKNRRKAEEEVRFNNALQGLAASQALINANRPSPPAFAPAINCRSRNVYGTVYTDCN